MRKEWMRRGRNQKGRDAEKPDAERPEAKGRDVEKPDAEQSERSRINMGRLAVALIPQGVPVLEDFKVRLRTEGQEWEDLGTYLAKVDMHDVREASVASFGFEGRVECEVESLRETVHTVEIRPRSAGVEYDREGNRIRFFLDRPVKLSVEINGDRFHNLHLFAEKAAEEALYSGARIIMPKDDGEELDLEEVLAETEPAGGRRLVCLAPGLHRLKGNRCELPSGTTVILSRGAVVMGSFLLYHKKDVSIVGSGMIYLGHVKKETYLRGADISYSENVLLEGVTIMNPAHYSVHLGNSKNVCIRGIKAFSCVGWSDGIDMMACRNICIEDAFLRNSDDCIAVYGGRGDYVGDTRNVSVRHCILWADVAHPSLIGVHGDSKTGGSIIENISFQDVDILEHHEPQDDYLGCMAINAGDDNVIRNVSYRDIRVEQFERGKLLDIQVKWNKKYNPVPGKAIENILFENISYDGEGEHSSEIRGYDGDRRVEGVRFHNLVVRGKHVRKPEEGNIRIGGYAQDIVFR